jgi:hypothetical protein
VKQKTWKFDKKKKKKKKKKPRPTCKGLEFSVAGHFNMNYFSAKLGVLFVWFGKKGNLTVRCEIKYYSANT